MRAHLSTAAEWVECGSAEDSTAALLARVLFHGIADPSHEDGLLARYAGPALLIDTAQHAIAANPAGALLADALNQGHAPDLARLVCTCIRDNVARHESVLTPVSDGPVLETAILPAGDGSTALVLCRDVTLERSLIEGLSESRQRYKDLVEIAGDFAWETDADQRFAFISPRGALGHAATDLIGRSPLEFMTSSPDHRPSSYTPFTSREIVEGAQVDLRRADGAMACLSVSAVPLFGIAGDWLGARGICRELVERRP
jgi:PAS domain S-box-containing protein